MPNSCPCEDFSKSEAMQGILDDTEEKCQKDQVVTANLILLNQCLNNGYESPPALGS